MVSFDANVVAERHFNWLKEVEQRISLEELNPQPYWGFDDLFHKAGTKLLNCFYIRAEVKKEKKKEFFWYTKIIILRKVSLEKFLQGIEKGFIYVDFDARTHHNHGTKFRLRQDKLPELYEEITSVE